MKAIELIGDIDGQHRLNAQVPQELPAGPVRLIVLLSEEDDGGAAGAHDLTREWADELRDARQDIYTLARMPVLPETQARMPVLPERRTAS